MGQHINHYRNNSRGGRHSKSSIEKNAHVFDQYINGEIGCRKAQQLLGYSNRTTIVGLDLEFSYKFDQSRVTDVFTQFKGQSGESVKNTFIKPKMKAWTQEVTAKYPVTDVFGDKRQELNEALDEYLKQKFEPYGIIIDTVNFTSISTDDETQAAIQKKVNAQQELELANIEAKTAKVQADKDKEVALIAAEQEKEKASIQAEQAKIDAEGKAEAIKIKAEAEAEANRKIAESLTPELIEKQKIDKWNGEVPKIQGGNTSTIVDTRDMTADENAE
ncbi:MAG: SPFH domain / Band 7 family protein [Bacteriophage sp.]|nr:MAG: SPFH domain / Band 7 family protein [Bacteriophage sp.]